MFSPGTTSTQRELEKKTLKNVTTSIFNGWHIAVCQKSLCIAGGSKRADAVVDDCVANNDCIESFV